MQEIVHIDLRGISLVAIGHYHPREPGEPQTGLAEKDGEFVVSRLDAITPELRAVYDWILGEFEDEINRLATEEYHRDHWGNRDDRG